MILLPQPRSSTSNKVAGTDSFRLASSMLLDTWGDNLQNPSKTKSKIYVPDEGKVFIQRDQAGAEALIVSYLTPHGNFRDLFLNGIKPHVYVALHLFSDYWRSCLNGEAPPTDIKIPQLKAWPRWKELNNIIRNDDVRYFLGKKSCHSFNYRKRPRTFVFDILVESEGRIALTNKEGEFYYNTYHTLFPEIQTIWWVELEQQIRKHRYLFNLFGFPCYFHDAITDELLRQATSWIPQSTVGIITHNAYVSMQEYIEEENKPWDLLINKHDSILMQVPEDTLEIQEADLKLKEFLEPELTSPRGEKFKMKSEGTIGHNWGKWHKDKNPKGMKEIES